MPENDFNNQYRSERKDPKDTSRIPPPPGTEDIKQKLNETEKLLAQEKEKTLLANLKSQQEAAFTAKLEASLKDLQQRVQRDRREREIDQERNDLKDRVKALESKLINERETWIQILRNQFTQGAPAQQQAAAPQPPLPQQEHKSPEQAPVQPQQQESSLIQKLEEMNTRWVEERKRFETLLAARQETPQADYSRINELEDKLRQTAQDKDVLASELRVIKDNLLRMEKQSSALDQIAGTIASFKEALANMRAMPAQGMSPSDLAHEIVNRERDLSNAREELKSLRSRQDKYDQTIQEKDAELNRAAEEKVRAINDLLALKKSLLKMKAVNAALEREYTQAVKEKDEAVAQIAQKTEQLQQLTAELSEVKTKHQTELDEISKKAAEQEKQYGADIAEATRKWEEKNLKVESLETELARIQNEHSSRATELETLLKEQSEKYSTHLEEQQQAQERAESRLKQLEEEKTSLEAKLNSITTAKLDVEAEKNALTSEREKLKAERNALLSDRQKLVVEIQKLLAEKKSLTETLQLSMQQAQKMTAQKQETDKFILDLRQKMAQSNSLIDSFKTQVSALNTKNSSLEGEISKQKQIIDGERKKASENESKLKDMLAQETAVSTELKKQISYYESLAESLMNRLKWVFSGKKPQ